MLARLAAAVAAFAAMAAGATTFSTDASDLWWNPNEPGWGVNLSQQGDTLFATVFVYALSGEPTWYVASEMAFQGGRFTGPLYQTRGPWFGGAFNRDAVTVRRVGSASFSYSSPDSASFSYSVDGATVDKSITRQTFKRNDLRGTYVGAFVGTYSGCGQDGYVEEAVEMTVEQGASTISLEVKFRFETCTFAGSYTQAGRLGTIAGEVDCGNGAIGPFTGTEIEATRLAISGLATARYRDCRWSGRFGGVRSGAEP